MSGIVKVDVRLRRSVDQEGERSRTIGIAQQFGEATVDGGDDSPRSPPPRHASKYAGRPAALTCTGRAKGRG
jgi:hypothetical protein